MWRTEEERGERRGGERREGWAESLEEEENRESGHSFMMCGKRK